MRANYLKFLVTIFFALPSAAAGHPLMGLDFLIGTWSGGAPDVAGTDEFRRELDSHVLKRHSKSVTAASKEKAQGSMQAELTIYPTGEGDALAAIYFDNEGHVIQYSHVTVTPGQRVEFLSDSRELSPGFRLTYSLKARDVLHVKFEMALPGQSTYHLIAEADETAQH